MCIRDSIDPVAEYSHREGISVTGGQFYEGTAIPKLRNHYLFADYVSGIVWAIHEVGPATRQALLSQRGLMIASFAKDHVGELWVCFFNDSSPRKGRISKLVQKQ